MRKGGQFCGVLMSCGYFGIFHCVVGRKTYLIHVRMFVCTRYQWNPSSSGFLKITSLQLIGVGVSKKLLKSNSDFHVFDCMWHT